MKNIGSLILLITIILGGVLFSCRKLPPLPDNYETLFAKPGNLDEYTEEVTIECESNLDDNKFFTDLNINNVNNFEATSVENVEGGSYFRTTAVDIGHGVTLEIEYPKLEFDYLYMTKKYRARSSYTNQTYPARVELTHDVNYTTYQYELLEGSDIYVEYKNSEIIISLCELEFEQQFGSQEIVTLSGRIIYDK